MNIMEAIKRCAEEAMEAKLPCDVIFGTVESVDPCKIRAGVMEIEGDVLYLTENVKYKSTTVKFSTTVRTVVINEGLKRGDTVLLLRQTGAEAYAVIAKV